MAMSKNEMLLRYTEAAIALMKGAVPGIVYMPPEIRASKQRLTTEGVMTNADYAEQEVIKRIAAADPAGLLIAIMNGLPIPGFRIVQRGEPRPKTNKGGKPTHKHAPTLPDALTKVETFEDGTEVFVEYYTPTLGHRERAAQYLLASIMPNKKSATTGGGKGPAKPTDDYAALVARRALEAGTDEPGDA